MESKQPWIDGIIRSAIDHLELLGCNPNFDELCLECPELQTQVIAGYENVIAKNSSLRPQEAVDNQENEKSSVNLSANQTTNSKVSQNELPIFVGYTTKRHIGTGSYGSVYEAETEEGERKVAIKVLKQELCSQSDARQRFIDEAMAMSAAKHPNVVEIYGVCDAVSLSSLPYIIMEYVAGGTLRQKLDTGRMTTASAAELVCKLASAVHNMHNQPRSIIHRDLKPDNIVLQGDNPKIADFGIARRTDHSVTVTQRLGSPAYMAPEQIGDDGGALVGPATDIWALGVILFECLTNRRPFVGTVAEIFHRIQTKEYIWKSEDKKSIPEQLRAICIKCLEKDPKDRYASAAQLEDDLKRFTKKEPVSARLPRWYELAFRYVKHQSKIVIGVAVSVFVGFAVLGTWAWIEKLRADKAIIQANIDRDTAFAKEREARIAEKKVEVALIARMNGLGEAHAKLEEWDRAAMMFAHAASRTEESSPARTRDFRRAQGYLERTMFPVRAIREPDLRMFAFSPSGRYLSVVTKTQRCSVWDIETEQKYEIATIPSKCTCAVWESVNDRLAVSTPQGQISVIDIPSGNVVSMIQSQPNITTMRYSPSPELFFSWSSGVRKE
jgi:eukaryotic-like serine/threonine-protein kinase